jgi:hypothetical protein
MATTAPGYRDLPARRSGRPMRLMPQRKRKTAFAIGGFVWIAFVALMVLNVALPKGGTRIEGFPVTWGYVAIGAMTAFAAIGTLRRRDIALPPIIQACCLMMPMAIITYYKAQHYGLPSGNWFQYAVLFGFFPVAILVFMSPYLEQLQARHIASVLLICIRFAVAWGLLNFTLFLAVKEVIEIPYVTVNGAEHLSVMMKNNMRGSIMKLVSSYNNGNIFGVCMVMLMPLYFHIEKRKGWLAAFVIALLCTLSRTAWFAMTGAFLLMVLAGQIRVNRVSVWVSLGAAFCAFLAILPLLGWTSANLIDDRLGGRIRYLQRLEISFFGQNTITIPEVVYYGLLQSYGLIGLVIALAALSFGAFYGLTHWSRLSQMRRSATLGVMAYLFAAMMDGAFVFPPVFPLFLFVNALIYRRGYRVSEMLLPSPIKQQRPHRTPVPPGDAPPHPAIPS